MWGDHGVKSIAFIAAGTHLAGSWRRRTALLLMTPAAVPVRCSLPTVTSQPKACYTWLLKLIDIGSWASSENLFTQWHDLFPALFVHEASRTVSYLSLLTLYRVRTHHCVSDCPQQQCVVTSGDGFLRGAITLRLCVCCTCYRICQSCA